MCKDIKKPNVTDEKNNNTNSSRKSNVVKKSDFIESLKEYWGFIIIIVSIIGGAVAVNELYATRKQLEDLTWYTVTYNSMIESRLTSSILSKQKKEKDILLEPYLEKEEKNICDKACKNTLKSYKEEISEINKKLLEESADTKKAQDALDNIITRIIPKSIK